jgi:hypothetical protein
VTDRISITFEFADKSAPLMITGVNGTRLDSFQAIRNGETIMQMRAGMAFPQYDIETKEGEDDLLLLGCGMA